MLSLVTSYTREPVSFPDAKHVSPSVLSVVVNKARRPSDLLLVPYEQVLQLNLRRGMRLIETPAGIVVQTPNGQWGAPFDTEAQAQIAYWSAHLKNAAKTPPNTAQNPKRKVTRKGTPPVHTLA